MPQPFPLPDGPPFTRWPVVRRGERPPISPALRRAVYARDGNQCLWCGHVSRLVLDHIVPWSAGGSNRAENLRTLCWDCNERRSNHHDLAGIQRRLPVTYHCRSCAPHSYDPDGDVVRAYCATCGQIDLAELLNTM